MTGSDKAKRRTGVNILQRLAMAFGMLALFFAAGHLFQLARNIYFLSHPPQLKSVIGYPIFMEVGCVEKGRGVCRDAVVHFRINAPLFEEIRFARRPGAAGYRDLLYAARTKEFLKLEYYDEQCSSSICWPVSAATNHRVLFQPDQPGYPYKFRRHVIFAFLSSLVTALCVATFVFERNRQRTADAQPVASK